MGKEWWGRKKERKEQDAGQQSSLSRKGRSELQVLQVLQCVIMKKDPLPPLVIHLIQAYWTPSTTFSLLYDVMQIQGLLFLLFLSCIQAHTRKWHHFIDTFQSYNFIHHHYYYYHAYSQLGPCLGYQLYISRHLFSQTCKGFKWRFPALAYSIPIQWHDIVLPNLPAGQICLKPSENFLFSHDWMRRKLDYSFIAYISSGGWGI